ncbi:MAG TPA: hypothetical protein VGE73_02615 [Pseudolabrys sp.]
MHAQTCEEDRQTAFGLSFNISPFDQDETAQNKTARGNRASKHEEKESKDGTRNNIA